MKHALHSPSGADDDPVSPVWLGAAVLLAIAGALVETGPLALVPSLAILALGMLAFLRPFAGLVALFPLTIALQAAPAGIGLRELAFAVLCAGIHAGTLVAVVKRGELKAQIRTAGPVILLYIAFVIFNAAVALSNDVPAADWLRGAVPFIFLSMAWPVLVLLGHRPGRVKWLAASLYGMAFLFSLQLLAVYWAEGIYIPTFYQNIDGATISTTVPEMLVEGVPVLGPYYDRVTLFLDQSTDALLPVGLSVSFVLCVLSPSRGLRVAAGLLLVVSLAAILTTHTRSMLLSAALCIGLFGLSLLFFQRAFFLRGILTGIGMVVAGVLIVFLLNLDQIWSLRFSALLETLGASEMLETRFGGGSGSPQIETAADENVLTRLVEYRIALATFYEHPVAGAGLGVSHEISFMTNEGEALHQTVAYIHNWVLYMLMVGGVMGMALYAALLATPVFRLGLAAIKRYDSLPQEMRSQMLLIFHCLWVGMLTALVYGLFFAVFRLISFNLMLAALIGVSIAIRHLIIVASAQADPT